MTRSVQIPAVCTCSTSIRNRPHSAPCCVHCANPNAGAGQFGGSISAIGNRALIGAVADNQAIGNSGTAFLFDVDPSSTTYGTSRATFKKPTPAAADQFGAAAGFLGDDVLVGAPFDDSVALNAGRVYRYNATGFATLSATAVNENAFVTLGAAFFEGGLVDRHTVLIDWADGSPFTQLVLGEGVYTFTASHQYLDDTPSGTTSDVKSIRVRVLETAQDILAVNDSADRLDRFDGSTTVSLGTFVASGAGGLDNPSAVAVGPNGDVYISSGAGNKPSLAFQRGDRRSRRHVYFGGRPGHDFGRRFGLWARRPLVLCRHRGRPSPALRRPDRCVPQFNPGQRPARHRLQR